MRSSSNWLVFEMPKAFADNLEVVRSPSECIHFVDGDRMFDVNLTPLSSSRFLAYDFGKAMKPIDSQLYRQIASVSSDDFSYGMSLDELRWHKYQITHRQFMSKMADIEYFDSAHISGNLLNFYPGYSFEWSTTDDRWHGAITFVDRRDETNVDWIRHVCATFRLEGDPPEDVENLHEDTIKELIEIAE